MKEVKNVKYMLFFYLTYMILSKTLIKHDRFQVELLIFSGKENPKLSIDNHEYQTLLDKLSSNNTRSNFKLLVMGYKGFLLTNLSNSQIPSRIINRSSTAELYLLTKLETKLSNEVYTYILQQIQIRSTTAHLIKESITNFVQRVRGNNICDTLPIIGTDSVPDYNPAKDAKGCFEKNLAYNNCYNYGNDIVSNTFAQPGKGSNAVWNKLTCEAIQISAESDGLKWIGKDYPTDLPALGHYVTLMIWNKVDFHWLRLDSNGYWSHKPGQTAIKNIDNEGSVIRDPSKQDLYPYTEFCGYFLTIPSKVLIK